MRTLLVICVLALFSCGNKNTNAQTQETAKPNEVEKIVQNDTNFPSVFLSIDFSGEVQVFDKPNGNIVKTLKNDIGEENFVLFDLLEKNDSMFYVVAYFSLDREFIIRGWIYNKNNNLGIYSSTYNKPFILYKTPYNRKEVIATEKEYNPNMYEVIDFDDKWLRIRTKINGKIYEGWIPPEEQCCNVYSTCN